MQKTIYYIIAILILLGINLYLLFSSPFSETGDTDETYFEEEFLVGINEISFSYRGQQIRMELQNQSWMLNDSVKADEGFVNTLLSVLERVRSTRKIDNWEGEALGSLQLSSGERKVNLEYNTNPTSTKSYFKNEGEVSEVTVPGYRDNVIDIFTLHPDQWKDRLVFDGSWRTIQRVMVDYRGELNLDIKFDDNFFRVNGESPQDSTAVVDYLNQYQYFQANEMISKGRFPEMDSLSNTEPIALITIDDIKLEQPVKLSIFPSLGNQSYHLVTSDKKMMVFDTRRIKDLLATPSRFIE